MKGDLYVFEKKWKKILWLICNNLINIYDINLKQNKARALMQIEDTGEVISAQKTSHKHNKDMSHLQ